MVEGEEKADTVSETNEVGVEAEVAEDESSEKTD